MSNVDENILILSYTACLPVWANKNNKRKLISAICVIEAVGGGCAFITK